MSRQAPLCERRRLYPASEQPPPRRGTVLPPHPPDITTCRDCSQFCLNVKCLAAYRKRKHKESAVPGPVGQLAPITTSPPPAPDPAPPDILDANQDLSEEQLLDLFQRLLACPPTSYRPPSLPGHTRGVTGGGKEMYTGVYLLPGLVAECHFGK
jgi:hypothetical protein